MATGRMPQNLELPEQDRKDRQDTSRALSRLTRLVAKHAREAAELHEMVSTQGPRATAKTGEIRKEIYAAGAIHPQGNSDLARLPPEILQRINSYLPLAPAVSLSLACKQLAAHAANARDHNQILFTNKDAASKDAASKAANSPTTKKPTKAKPKAPPISKPQKLDMLLLLTPWFPDSLTLCYRCLKFRPRNRANWTTNLAISSSGLATQKAIEQGPKCPSCTEWIALQRGRESVSFKKALEGVRRCVK